MRDRLALWLWTRPFFRLPPLLWLLVASPLLWWAGGCVGGWRAAFRWPASSAGLPPLP